MSVFFFLNKLLDVNTGQQSSFVENSNINYVRLNPRWRPPQDGGTAVSTQLSRQWLLNEKEETF